MDQIVFPKKKKTDNSICHLFFYPKSKTARSLKKEDLRTKLFRKHKTFLLKFLNNKAKAKKCKQNLNPIKLMYFNAFYEHYVENSHELTEASKKESQPRNNFSLKNRNKHRSYNDNYISEYLSNPEVKKSFILMLNYFFCEIKTDELSIMFNVEAKMKEREKEDWFKLIRFIYIAIGKCTDVEIINYSSSEFEGYQIASILNDALFDVFEVLDLPSSIGSK